MNIKSTKDSSGSFRVAAIDILNEPDKDYSEAFLTEKFGDVMNYFMLMYADLVERDRK